MRTAMATISAVPEREALRRPLSRSARTKAFLRLLEERIANVKPRSKAEALDVINKTLNAVEDRFSGVAWNAGMPIDRDSGRLLPLASDLYVGPAVMWSDRLADVSVVIAEADFYQTRGNNVFVANNGAFELWSLQRTDATTGAIVPPVLLVRCPGFDGRTITA